MSKLFSENRQTVYLHLTLGPVALLYWLICCLWKLFIIDTTYFECGGELLGIIKISVEAEILLGSKRIMYTC